MKPSAAAAASPDEPVSGVRPRGGFSRARFHIERRTPVLRSAPARLHEAPFGAIAKPWEVKPFEDVVHVPARTRAVSVCAACASASSPDCAACQGTGVVATWVEIEIAHEHRVLACGDCPNPQRDPALYDPADFERVAPGTCGMIHQAWHRGIPSELSPTLLPELATNERVDWTLVQTFVR